MTAHIIRTEDTQPDRIDFYGNPAPHWLASCSHGVWEHHSYHSLFAAVQEAHRGQTVEIRRMTQAELFDQEARTEDFDARYGGGGF